jgi:putative spermidine/putrescine transport system substrate-binding protein
MKKHEWTRRDVLKTGALVTGGLLVNGMSPAPSSGATKSLIVNSYGGVYEKAVRENFAKCFQSKTNIPAEIIVGIPSAVLAKIRASQPKPDVDVFIATASTTIEAINQNLVEKIDPKKVPNLKDVPKINIEQWEGYGVSFSYGVGGIMYNKEKIKNPPQSWAEFVDRTIKGDFGKKVTIPSLSSPESLSVTLWTIANAFGGSVAKPDIAFEKLKVMRNNIPKFYSDLSEVVNMMSTGEVDIAMYPDGRAWAFHDMGNPWVGWIAPKPGGVFQSSQCMKVKNSAPEAWEFINCLIDPVAQEGFTKMIKYPVTNLKVKYPQDLVNRMTPQKDLIYPPHQEIMKQAALWAERWNKEIGG